MKYDVLQSKYFKNRIDLILLLLTGLFFLNIYDTFNYIGLLLATYLMWSYHRVLLSIDVNIILLLIFGITYVIFSSFNIDFSIRRLYAFVFLPWLIYNLGRANALRINDEKNLILIILFLSVSISFIYLYSVLESYYLHGLPGIRSVDLRFMSRVEETQIRAATGVALYVSALIPFLPVLVLTNQGIGKAYLITGSIFSILALVVTLMIATRFPIAIFGIIFTLLFLYNLKSQYATKKILAVIVILVTAYFMTSTNFQEIEITAGLYNRFQEENVTEFGARSQRWKDGYENIFTHPFGGEQMQYSYFHNVWLDIRKVAGVVPMLIFLIFTINSIRLYFSFIRDENASLQNRSLIGSMFIVFITTMFIEPVIEGAFVFFLLYIFYVGFIKQYHYSKNKDDKYHWVNSSF